MHECAVGGNVTQLSHRAVLSVAAADLLLQLLLLRSQIIHRASCERERGVRQIHFTTASSTTTTTRYDNDIASQRVTPAFPHPSPASWEISRRSQHAVSSTSISFCTYQFRTFIVNYVHRHSLQRLTTRNIHAV